LNSGKLKQVLLSLEDTEIKEEDEEYEQESR